jgi:hypothetical protein
VAMSSNATKFRLELLINLHSWNSKCNDALCDPENNWDFDSKFCVLPISFERRRRWRHTTPTAESSSSASAAGLLNDLRLWRPSVYFCNDFRRRDR